MPQNTARLKLYIWIGTAIVIAMVCLAMALILHGFEASRQQSDHLRLILCDSPALKDSQYCHIIRTQIDGAD